MSNGFWVYMVTNWTNDVLYIGMTNNLERRLSEHKSRKLKGFTQLYNSCKLVFQEPYATHAEAFAREQYLKGWKRDRKNALVTLGNPAWRDLSEAWYAEDPSLRSG